MTTSNAATGPSGNSPDGPVAVVVVAGGAGRRLGGIDKPALRRQGRSLVERILAAAPPTAVRVLVGPPRSVPADVRQTVEDPPGSGPAAAVVAGLAALEDLPDDAAVVLLAGDLVGVTPTSVLLLLEALPADRSAAAAVVDVHGRVQYLFSAHRAGGLRDRVRSRGSWTDAGVHALFSGSTPTPVSLPEEWIADVDVPADLDRWGVDRADTDRTPRSS